MQKLSQIGLGCSTPLRNKIEWNYVMAEKHFIWCRLFIYKLRRVPHCNLECFDDAVRTLHYLLDRILPLLLWSIFLLFWPSVQFSAHFTLNLNMQFFYWDIDRFITNLFWNRTIIFSLFQMFYQAEWQTLSRCRIDFKTNKTS